MQHLCPRNSSPSQWFRFPPAACAPPCQPSPSSAAPTPQHTVSGTPQHTSSHPEATQPSVNPAAMQQLRMSVDAAKIGTYRRSNQKQSGHNSQQHCLQSLEHSLRQPLQPWRDFHTLPAAPHFCVYGAHPSSLLPCHALLTSKNSSMPSPVTADTPTVVMAW